MTKPYKNVFSLENNELVKNTENKIEYTDENGIKRVKTNPSYSDFLKVGKYRLKEDDLIENTTHGEVFYEISGEYIVKRVKEG